MPSKKKPLSTQLTQANIQTVLKILADSPGRLENLEKALVPSQTSQPVEAGERSCTETLAHLIHCEAQSSEMIYQALLADEPCFLDIHPEREYGKLVRFDLLGFSELVIYFNLRRRVLLRVLRSLKETEWARTIREEGKQRQESVYWRARTIAQHELDHLDWMESKLVREVILGNHGKSD